MLLGQVPLENRVGWSPRSREEQLIKAVPGSSVRARQLCLYMFEEGERPMQPSAEIRSRPLTLSAQRSGDRLLQNIAMASRTPESGCWWMARQTYTYSLNPW